MKADLHVHTTASDGRLAPEEVMTAAAAADLSHIAITDHDTLDGLAAIMTRPAASAPVLIPGIEFSTDLPANEVHVLGYYIDPANGELRRQLKLITEDRTDRAERMVAKLAKLGYPLSVDRVLAIAGDTSSVGRPHVAAALIERGYFPDNETVFDAVLGHDRPGYVPHYKLTPADTIAIIKGAGGLAVLAHPGLVGDDAIVKEVIALGVDGLEVYHPRHDPAETARYVALAAACRLLVTGGSDFHGIPGRFPEKLGVFTVPGELAERLATLSRHEYAPDGI